jgi:acetoin utilization deacetylase AcuC-like enzyme
MVRELAEAGGGRIDADTAVGEATYRAALHAAGGACELTRALAAGEAAVGYSCMRPSGHHAERDRAMGFCYFNNVAVAAALAIAELGLERVAIFDWDVHHGNGTAEIFRERADVLFLSIHQSPLYPGTGPASDRGSGPGEGYTVNLPVPPGSGEDVWLGLVDEVVVPGIERYAPQLILVSAGYDAHRADPLASCELESASFAAMATRLGELAARLGVPLGFVQEGGYHVPSLVESLLATMAALTPDPAG